MIYIENFILWQAILHEQKSSYVDYRLRQISSLMSQVIEASRIYGRTHELLQSHRSHAAKNHEKWAV